MPYQSPVNEFRFLFENVVDFKEVCATARFAEATPDVVDAILSEAGKLCDTALAPLNRIGDTHPAALENGVVRSPPGFGEGFKAMADGGWVGLAADPEFGGMGLPLTLNTALTDMMSGACLSLQLSPLLTQGQIEALQRHASEEIKALYLPKLNSGEWSGTMNLTEPQAGSDVGALSARAVANDDGTYAVSGQKIFITWGDCDFVSNVCHLVLARLPDSAPGTKGISLFMVPKFIPDENGNAGVANRLKVISLEHKLGIHGSPTAVMDYDGATGWLVGEENGGMAAMFTMMNSARLSVGAQGVGVAEAATQLAVDYAMQRKQGRVGRTGTIVEHADVRRMLMRMKADTQAARAIALSCAVAIDMERATSDTEWGARAAFLTPIAKAFGTDIGCEIADTGVQIHGGMGFIEETGAAQFLRDVRITPIYEGTNGIQAMDLVGRKMADGGETAFRLLDEIEEGAERARLQMPTLGDAVWSAAESLRETTECLAKQDIDDRFAVAVPYLRAFARILGAHYHLRSALAVGGQGPRAVMANFYVKRLLPEYIGLLVQVREGASDLYALSADDLVA